MLCSVRKKDGEVVHLTPTEARLFDVLREKSKRVISKATLLEKAWGSPHYGEWQVKKYIVYLRRKLEPEPRLPQIIVNVRGAGYYLADDSKVSPEKLEEIFECSGFKFYPERYLLIFNNNGKETILTPKETRLLEVLAKNINKFVSSKRLISLVWQEIGANENVARDYIRHLKVYIYYLRRKIEPDCRGDYQYIRSKRFFGYGLFDEPGKK